MIHIRCRRVLTLKPSSSRGRPVAEPYLRQGRVTGLVPQFSPGSDDAHGEIRARRTHEARERRWRRGAVTCPVRMWETAVVAVIEGKEEAGGVRYIEFKVYRSSTDLNRILGSWRFAHGESTLIDQSKLGTSVETEFRCVVDCADQHGIPFVWVDDPDELFPPWTRP
jgi:hypothetical protein